MARWKVTSNSERKQQRVIAADWDGASAHEQLLSWAGWPDNPNPERAQQGFLFVDEEKPLLKDSYRYPLAIISDDKLTPIASAIREASAAIAAETDDLPSALLAEARAVLDDLTPARNVEVEEGVIAFPAQVIGRGNNGLLLGLSDDELMRLAKDRAGDPSIFDDFKPYFWAAQISNNSIDSYFTRMMKSSLQNYANDADAGVAFQNSHNCRELPMGGSLKGKFTGANGNGNSRVEAAFYTIPGLQPGQLSTDQLIMMMRAGTVHDVSIGFYGGFERCSVCGNDIMDWRNCMHWPGEWIDETNAKGDVINRVQCIAEIEDAKLAEVSAVYDGATPGAAITKARMVSEAGLMKPDQARILEQRYRIKLPASHRVYTLSGGQNTVTEEEKLAEQQRAAAAKEAAEKEAAEAATRAAAAKTAEEAAAAGGAATTEGERGTAPPPAAPVVAPPPATTSSDVRSLLVAGTMSQSVVDTINNELTRLNGEVARLAPLADDGKKWRLKLIDDAMLEGKRALGADFPEEVYRALLNNADIDGVRKVLDSFKVEAAKKFPGGRQTADTSTAATAGTVAPGNGGTNPENPDERNAPTMVEIEADDSAYVT